MSNIPRFIPEMRIPRVAKRPLADGRATTGEDEPDHWVFEAREATEQGRLVMARAAALIYGVVALALARLVTVLLEFIVGENSVTQAMWIVAVPAAAGWGYMKQKSKPGQVWTSREWIDFGNRTWNTRRHYADGSEPLISRKIPLSGVAAVCYAQMVEDEMGYTSVLSRVSDLVRHRHPWPLTRVEHFDTEQECLAFTQAMAARCAIACWQFREAELEGGKAMLEKLS
ncbi:hypothetical protein LXA47_22410 [Massilia sp. P8910]|uniref:hypothetical protein n=1 Tax=Massilia antarctica TaxID=2765360 RepID=UPI000B04411F|nr:MULTISPECIES: hypothetical protein [Massilia]MCE3606335.1 hypothetical protein [Massilia antarctica]MCY0910331.1 hypothetical protein [Massilia sp. H27-R4]